MRSVLKCELDKTYLLDCANSEYMGMKYSAEFYHAWESSSTESIGDFWKDLKLKTELCLQSV